MDEFALKRLEEFFMKKLKVLFLKKNELLLKKKKFGVLFSPSKITVDNTERMYVIAKNVFGGIVELSQQVNLIDLLGLIHLNYHQRKYLDVL